MSLTLSRVVVGQWWNLFLLLQDSNAPIMCLITPHFKTNIQCTDEHKYILGGCLVTKAAIMHLMPAIRSTNSKTNLQ